MVEHGETFVADQIQTACLGISRDALEHVSIQSQETPEQCYDKDRLGEHSEAMHSRAYTVLMISMFVVFQAMQRSLIGIPRKTFTFIEMTLSSVFTFAVQTFQHAVIAISSGFKAIKYVWNNTHRFIIGCRQSFSTRHVFMLFPKSEGHSDQYGTCSSKVPPSWDPAWDRHYPFHIYQQDLGLWLAGVCELDAHQQGPAIAMRLQGVARDIVRVLDMNTLMHGRVIPNPNNPQGQAIVQTGAQYLLEVLRNRFGMLPQETAIQSISEFLMFSRQQGETTDQVISRFEIHRQRALTNAGLTVSETGCSWMLLMLLGIPVDKWPVLLHPFAGALPGDAAQYAQFILYLRRNGHLYDRGNNSMRHPYFTHGSQDDQEDETYPTPLGMFPSLPGPSNAGQEEDTYTMSSGQSDDEEFVDWQDVEGLGQDEIGERLYTQYRTAKRRWRQFSGPPKRHFRRFRRKGKGKGKSRFGKGFKGGFGKGKGSRFPNRGKGFGGKGSPVFPEGKGTKTFFGEEEEYEPDEDWTGFEPMYPTAKVKTNPLGPDGKPLKCLVCGSIEHFRNKCPKRDQKPQYYEHTDASSSSTNARNEQRTVWYNAPESTARALGSDSETIMLDNGSFIIIQSSQSNHVHDPSSYPEVQSSDYQDPFNSQTHEQHEQSRSWMTFVQWIHGVGSSAVQAISNLYHSEVRLQGYRREGLLVDTGAVENISGLNFIKRVGAISKSHGGKVVMSPMKEVIGVSGIGKHSDQCTHEATIPICLPDGRRGSFSTPIISNPDIPAIWGLNSMSSQRVVIDTHNKMLICVGQKGYTMKASQGTVTYKLETSTTGHLFLPITEYRRMNARKQVSKDSVSL